MHLTSCRFLLTLKDNNPFNATLPQVSRTVSFNGVLLPATSVGTSYFLLSGITGPPSNVTTSPQTRGRCMSPNSREVCYFQLWTHERATRGFTLPSLRK
ncbi:MAG: hypothetical protein JWO08_2560 [Verrucomicrobiaceae bacterium]|nr:hypothetical protein [Verrucomicrobiaceae bacterium]